MKRTIIPVLSFLLFLGTNLAFFGKHSASSAQTVWNPNQETSIANEDLERVSSDGAVTIKVLPLNLGEKGAQTIAFDVKMDTHSVNLNFDLSKLSLLRDGSGAEAIPSAWSASREGHHVEGKLVFPAGDIKNWKPLTLVVKNVAGIQERIFTWDLL